MTFIVTAKGFLKNRTTVVFERNATVEYTYTDKLREAKQFKTRGNAAKFLRDNDLQGFVYNPKEQEPIREMYVVRKYNPGWERRDDEINEWIVEKASGLHASDITFLNGRNDMTKYYSLEEAKRLCVERNKKMLEELRAKILAMQESEQINETQPFFEK